MNDGDLMIVNGNESHEGKYLCQANNGVGSGKSKLISINVDGKGRDQRDEHATAAISRVLLKN